jgi:hypothetical protein
MKPMNFYMVQCFDPKLYNEAMGNPLCQESMKKEYDSILKTRTWNLVPVPPETNIFMCKWVHRIKRYKARQVSKGRHQIHKDLYIFMKDLNEH